MDQVKVYLGVAKKHHFWILVLIVVIVAIVVWIKASGTLAAQYAKDKNTIEGAEKSLQPLSQGEQVNQKFTEQVNKLHDNVKQQVFDSWQKLYAAQVALLKWPVEETENGPIDLNLYTPSDDIPEWIRTYYNNNVIEDEWTELLEKVDLRRPKEKEETSVSEDESEDGERVVKRSMEYQGLVVWKEDLRKAIISRYHKENDTPSTKRLRLMQEDVWLFESLIDVINSVNAGATDPLRAPIKEIQTLDVAQWAIAAAVQSGEALTPPPGGSSAAPPAPPPATGTGAAGDDWEESRYLDERGEPLKDPNGQPFKEFRQVFVFMKFIMDQRKIPQLVAAAANAPLPIETRQVRVKMAKEDLTSGNNGSLFPTQGAMGGTMGAMNSGAGGGAQGMGAMGAMGGMGGGMRPPSAAPPGAMNPGANAAQMMTGRMGTGMPGSMGGGPMGMSMDGMGMGLGLGLGQGAQQQEPGAVETTDYDGVVELCGVVYLYNPPDINNLGKGGAAAPNKRSFGVPKTPPKIPGNSGSGTTTIGSMGGPPGSSIGGPPGANMTGPPGGPPANTQAK